MSGGIRVELTVDNPGTCPVANAAAETGVTIEETTRASTVTENGTIVEQFSLPADAELENGEYETVFEGRDRRVYRFGRDPAGDCVCSTIERAGCLVSNVRAKDGALYLTFYAEDRDAVRAVVEAVSGQFDGATVRRMIAQEQSNDESFVFVDRGTLTDRQREVLETSMEMGYFDYPKGANAGEVAGALGISPSTYREHLAAAQRKLFDAVIAE